MFTKSPPQNDPWWTDIDWGSVADWVAAVGTVGALFLGLTILLNDRRRHRRESADSFITWWELVYEETTDPKGHPPVNELRVYAFNTGNHPVQGAAILGIDPDDGEPLHDLLKQTGVDEIETIDPGERVKDVLIFDTKANVDDFYIEFVDGRGQLWHRKLKENKYVSRKKAYSGQK